MIKRAKISLIGGGNIGGTLAHMIVEKGLGDVVLLDRNEKLAKGKALDIIQSTAISKSEVKLMGTGDARFLEGSDVIIITAGVARKPGMSRDDLLNINSNIIKEVATDIKNYAPNAFVIAVTNPLDVMVWILWKYSELPAHKVVGMAGVLDSARMSYFLSQEFGVSVQDVRSFVLGTHGDNMIPLIRYSTIAGIPVMELVKKGWVSEDKINEIIKRTKNGGGEIVSLLQTGSAYYSPAASAIKMTESYLLDQKQILPCAAYIENDYGIRDVFLGVPVLIGSNGVEKIINVDLTSDEMDILKNSADSVKKSLSNLKL